MYESDKEYDDAIKFFQNASSDGADYSEDGTLTTFMKQNAGDIGNKLMVIFWVDLFSTILNVITNIAERLDSTKTNLNFLLGLEIVSIVLSIIYIVMLFLLKKYDKNFGTAAIICIANQLLGVLMLLFTDYALLLVLSLIAIVLSYVAQYCVIQGLINSVGLVFVELASRLQSYWKGYMIVTLSLIPAFLLLCVPGIALIALIAIIGLAIALIVYAIWNLILVWECASSMQNYAKFNSTV